MERSDIAVENVAAYTIPTDAPEGDGTPQWDRVYFAENRSRRMIQHIMREDGPPYNDESSPTKPTKEGRK